MYKNKYKHGHRYENVSKQNVPTINIVNYVPYSLYRKIASISIQKLDDFKDEVNITEWSPLISYPPRIHHYLWLPLLIAYDKVKFQSRRLLVLKVCFPCFIILFVLRQLLNNFDWSKNNISWIKCLLFLRIYTNIAKLQIIVKANLKNVLRDREIDNMLDVRPCKF